MVFGATCALSHGLIWRQQRTLHLQFHHRCSSLPFNFNNSKFSTFPLNSSPLPSIQLRFHDSRLSALSNDGSGGPGGGSAGRNSGNGDDDDGEEKRPLLSCIAKTLEPLDTLASSVWQEFVHYLILVGSNALVEYCQRLYLFMDFLASGLFSTYIYVGMGTVVSFALMCIILIIGLAYAYATTDREGASEEDIRSLPKYRFSQSNSMMMIDDNMVSNGSHRSENFLHPDDSECCICLCTYDDGTELYRLPCTHHFHCECISRWLQTKAICPICTLSIRGSRSVTSE